LWPPYQQRRNFFYDLKHYFWDNLLLFKLDVVGIHKRCIPKEEIPFILFHCHSSPYGGHASTDKMVVKIPQAGFFAVSFQRCV
jgi:hypothetical protein